MLRKVMNQIRNFSYTYNKLNQETETKEEISSHVNPAFDDLDEKIENNFKSNCISVNGNINHIDEYKDNDLVMKNHLKKTEPLPEGKKKLPKQAILSWHSLTIKADTRSLGEKIISLAKYSNKKKNHTTILDNVKGIVKPTEMLALMGPR